MNIPNNLPGCKKNSGLKDTIQREKTLPDFLSS